MIHKRMKQVREFYKKTQPQMAELLGIEEKTYQRIEQGARALDTFVIMQFTSVFGANEEWLKRGMGKMLDDGFKFTGATCRQTMLIGEHIRQIRCDNRLKQSEFAEEIGMSKSAGTTVSSWELGRTRVSDDSIERIEKRFKVNLSRLGNPEAILTIKEKPRDNKMKRLVSQARSHMASLNAVLGEMERLG